MLSLVVALLLQWVAIGYWIELAHRDTQEQAEAVLRQLTVAVHEQTLRLFKDVEGALKTVDFWIAAHPGVDPITDPEVGRLLGLIRDTSGGLMDLRLVTRTGQVYFTPDLGRPTRISVADRDYFKVQRDPATRGLYIGQSTRSRVTRQLAVPVSLPLSRPVGDITMVFASIPLDRLTSMYEQTRFKPGGTIALLRTDGTLQGRAPLDPTHVGVSIAGSTDYKNHIGIARSGIYTSSNSAIDGLSRLVSFSRLDEYPLIIVVSAGSDDVFESWSDNRRLVLICGVLLSLVFAAGAAGILFVLGVVKKSEVQLQRQALYDALTGTLNRHAFGDACNREFARAVRYRRPLTVAILDLDHFKHVNDAHGHAAGDAALRQLTAVWADAIRADDLLGRLGGEEFAILMPDTSMENGMYVAERLLQATRDARIASGDLTLALTTSIGLATAMPFDYRFEDLLERADSALYQAKRAGRDRIQAG